MEDIKDDELPDKWQTERIRALAEAMSNIKIYVEQGKNEGFVQIKPPVLTRFQLPVKDKDPEECQELQERDIVDPTTVARWYSNEVLHQVDLVKEEDKEYFGKMQKDAVTGEQYMLVPIDVDIIINLDTLTTVSTQEPATNGYTVNIQQPTEEREQGGSQHHNHVFTVPKLCLGFDLVMAPELPKEKGSKMDLKLNGNTKLPSSNLQLSPHSEMKL